MEQRNSKMNWLKRTVAVLFIVLFSVSASFVSSASEELEFIDISSMRGKKVGVVTGSFSSVLFSDCLEEGDMYPFKSLPDAILALNQGKVDAVAEDLPYLLYYREEAEGAKILCINGDGYDAGLAFAKNEGGLKLREEFNEFVSCLEADGEMERLRDKWYFGTEEGRVYEILENLPDVNGKLDIALDPLWPPTDYLKNEKLTGFEVELLDRFCEEYGYVPNYIQVSFEGILTGLASGKYDVGATGMVITEERKESMYFSEPLFHSYSAVLMAKEPESQAGLFKKAFDSFNRTILSEHRWKQLLNGAGITMIITAMSILLGLVLGFVSYGYCRHGGKLSKILFGAARKLVHGLPAVVLLMIFYYVIFGNSTLSGLWVSVIAFGVIFATRFHTILETAEKAVDPGQALAADAMGYPRALTYRKVILPQVLRISSASFNGLATAHNKATAIVGYIAVVDLTKAGDLIRGRTYEAFIPLISVAIGYFLMAGIIRLVVRVMAKEQDYHGSARERRFRRKLDGLTE